MVWVLSLTQCKILRNICLKVVLSGLTFTISDKYVFQILHFFQMRNISKDARLCSMWNVEFLTWLSCEELESQVVAEAKIPSKKHILTPFLT